MPNHCYNTLYVDGDGENIKTFMQGFELEEGFIKTYFPIPDGYLDDKRWYDWCIENWSTKWGDYETERESFDVLKFLSAWSPPIKALTHISTLFPDLTFSLMYVEDGIGYEGKAVFENGYCNDTTWELDEDYYEPYND